MNLINIFEMASYYRPRRLQLNTIKRYYRIERNQISYLRFLLEAYDGVGVLTTIDAAAGIVVLHVAPDCRAEAEMILKDVKKEILVEEIRADDLQQYLSIEYAGFVADMHKPIISEK